MQADTSAKPNTADLGDVKTNQMMWSYHPLDQAFAFEAGMSGLAHDQVVMQDDFDGD